MIQSLLALTAASLFTGAAVYISWAEHPARMLLDDRAALAHWQPSYARAVPMQAGLALVSGTLALWAWAKQADPLLLAGCLLIFAVVPFTLLVIMPVNKAMQATQPAQASPQTRHLLIKWGGLHWIRNLLGIASVVTLLIAIAP